MYLHYGGNGKKYMDAGNSPGSGTPTTYSTGLSSLVNATSYVHCKIREQQPRATKIIVALVGR